MGNRDSKRPSFSGLQATRAPPGVLLVDDVEANLIAMEAQLAKLDCQLVRASSGNEALKLLLKQEFAVMLLDVQMPEMGGYEVASYVRKNPTTRDMPIIFVTAMHETEENALRGYGAGAVDVLFKPINPDILHSKVKVFLDLYVNRRQLTDEIEAHKKTLAALETFNYSVSHDLKAPLRPLAGFSQVLLEDYGDKLDDQAKNYLNRIRAAALKMSQLIEDMLLLARMGRAEMNVGAVNLVPIANAIIDELKKDNPTREVEYVTVSDAVVEGDPRLLSIVLNNLLRNAWKFTQKTAQPRIEFGAKEGEPPTYFVRDNGAGFDMAYAAGLFRPFGRLHSDSEFEGTGIGLSIVQRIVERHGGKVWAEGAVGQGATIFLSL